MKKVALIFLVAVAFMQIIYSQPIPDSALYLGQIPPENTQKLFSLSLTAGYSAVERTAFSTDGKKIYYSELNVNYNYSFTNSRIKYYSYYNNIWNGPFTLFENFYSPSLSVSGDTMYFQKSNPQEVWYSVKTDTVWNTPTRFMGNLDIIASMQRTNSGTYFCSSASKGKSRLVITSTDTIAESLGDRLNSSDNSTYLNMAKDESYAIIYSFQGGGPDLEGRSLISYPTQDGGWTNPKQMGFGGWATTITPDNKYLFFSSIVGVNYSTYWIRVDNIIDSLKHTNFIPYVKTPIPTQTDTIGQPYNYTIPDTSFIDDDGNNTLTYLLPTLSNGNSLPSWLHYNSDTRTLYGTPDTTGKYLIKVMVTDTANATANAVYSLTITDTIITSIIPVNEQQTLIYPNPTEGVVNINLGTTQKQNTIVEVYDILGSLIHKQIFQNEVSAVIDLTGNPQGLYVIRLINNSEINAKKIYLK
jgi:hypothetical protein